MADPNNKRRTLFICAVLLLVTVAIYWPVSRYDFVDYDDDAYVFNNPTVKDGLTWWGFVWAFVDVHVVNWHPLTWLSHMLDCELFGLNAGAHHMVSAIIHSANAVLLFLLLNSTTGSIWRSAFAAALFAWHPLRVESVAWISERKDVLSGFFFLLTLWAYAIYTRNKSDERENVSRSKRFYLLALFFFALGLMSKPVLVTLPFVLLLLDFWPLNRFQFDNWKLQSPLSYIRANQKLLKEKLPFFGLSALFCLITIVAQKNATVAAGSGNSGQRIGNVFVGYLRYLESFVWPHDLNVLYLRREIAVQEIVLAAMVLLAISAIALLVARRLPFLITGWLLFLGVLVPVIGLVPVGLQSHADRYTYLPAIGLSLMVVWTGYDLFARWLKQKKAHAVFGAIGIVALITFATLTLRQLGYWKNTETLMKRALAIDPNNYIAHSNLGVYLSRQGRTEEALFHYQKARELDPLHKTNTVSRALKPNSEKARP